MTRTANLGCPGARNKGLFSLRYWWITSAKICKMCLIPLLLNQLPHPRLQLLQPPAGLYLPLHKRLHQRQCQHQLQHLHQLPRVPHHQPCRHKLYLCQHQRQRPRVPHHQLCHRKLRHLWSRPPALNNVLKKPRSRHSRSLDEKLLARLLRLLPRPRRLRRCLPLPG